jgi:hypothetical protein
VGCAKVRSSRHARGYWMSLSVNGQAPFEGLPNVLHQLVESFALGGAARDGRNFGPVPTFLGFVNNDFNPQARPPLP